MKQVIKGNMPFVETDYYKWLKDNYKNHKSFIESVKAYFDNEPAPFKGRNDLQYHKWTYDHYWRINIKPTL